MASLKITSLLILVIFFSVVGISISQSVPPTLPGPAPYFYPGVPVSPSYGLVPSPNSNMAEPTSPTYPSVPESSVPGPADYTPVPTTPSYAFPGPNSYPQVPASPAYILAPAPNSDMMVPSLPPYPAIPYPPAPEPAWPIPAPKSSPIKPPYPAYDTPIPATPSYVSPGPNSYPAVPASPEYMPPPAPNSDIAVPSLPPYPAIPYPPAPEPAWPIPAPKSSPIEPPYPAYDTPVPATPSYMSPGPNSYPAVPATPAYMPAPAPNSDISVPSLPPYPAIPYPPPPEPACPIPAPKSSPIEPASPPPSPSATLPPSRGVKAAYWPSFDGFPASSIDTSYFTHLYYAFLLPDPVTYKLVITPFDQEKLPEFTGTLRTRNPPVKTLLSIGGAGNVPTVFSKMASNKSTRAIFIHSTIKVARKYGFDGVDLDWEFPANDEDMSNLALLFKQWRRALVNEAKATSKTRLLLTSAVYYASKFSLFGEPRSYPGDSLRKHMDWISPMCFDYHGSWDSVTGEHAALYDPNSNISTSYGIESWIQAGVPPKKIVMGLPLYGRTWKLQDPNVNGVGAPAVGVGPGDGILVFSQVLDFESENNATVKFDGQTVGYYSYAGDSWIGYDGFISVQMKIEFARSRGLGGYFFWALGQDDKDWSISRLASNAWGY